MKTLKYVKDHFPMLAEIRYEQLINRRIRENKKISPKDLINNMYFQAMGFNPDLNNPRRYTEKMQWRKLYDENPLFSALSDKYSVRKWVETQIGAQYLIPCLGVWNSFDDIDFDKLPDEFVLKTNNASSTVVVINDKANISKKLLRKKFNYWMSMDYTYVQGYEKQYSHIRPLIIAEELIHDDFGDADLRDYKFLCFHGEVKFVWVDVNRYHNHDRFVFDTDWNLQPWNQRYEVHTITNLERPPLLDEMVELCKRLCSGFDHVRVDLYCTGKHIFFGEMTFTNGSGLEHIRPDEWDFVLGDMWHLPINNTKGSCET